MKRTILLLLLIAASISVYAALRLYPERRDVNKKWVADTSILTVTYSYRHILDTIDKRSLFDQYEMQIGRKFNKFYSTFSDRSDSTFYKWMKSAESKKIDAGVNVRSWMDDDRQNYSGDEYYINYPNKGNLTQIERIQATSYQYAEIIPTFNWKMDMLGQTEQILGYKCAKATTSFRGRRWEVWFTTEIPISSGPWKFSGLPGMILKATDNSGNFEFVAIGITQVQRPIYMYNIELKNASPKEVRRLLDMRWKDPIGLMMLSHPGINVYNSKTRKPFEPGDIIEPYIPQLELE